MEGTGASSPLVSTIRNCNGPEEEWGIRINGAVMICSSVHATVKSDNFLVIPKRPLVIINWPPLSVRRRRRRRPVSDLAAFSAPPTHPLPPPSRSLQRAKICLDRLSLVKLG